MRKRSAWKRKPVSLALRLQRARALAERIEFRRCGGCGKIRPLGPSGHGCGACTSCGWTAGLRG